MEYEITKILESDVDLSKKTKKLNLNSYNNIYMINSLFNEKESEKKLKELLKRENEGVSISDRLYLEFFSLRKKREDMIEDHLKQLFRPNINH